MRKSDLPRTGVRNARAEPGLFDEAHCEECSTIVPADPGTGWLAVRAPDGSEVWYCPACAAREFGDQGRTGTADP